MVQRKREKLTPPLLGTETLSVPKNMKLLAVPLFELYDNSQRWVARKASTLFSLANLRFGSHSSRRYGPQLAAIPHILSRYDFIYL